MKPYPLEKEYFIILVAMMSPTEETEDCNNDLGNLAVQRPLACLLLDFRGQNGQD